MHPWYILYQSWLMLLSGSRVPELAWPNGKIKKTMNGYIVNLVLATYVVIQRLAKSDRQSDLERIFVKFSSRLIEIFCDGPNHLLRARVHLLTSAITKYFIAAPSLTVNRWCGKRANV